MSTVLKFSVAGIIAVSLLVVTKGLAASSSGADDLSPRVQAAAADGPPDPATPVTNQVPAAPIAAPPISTPAPVIVKAPSITPVTLQHMVALRAAHPRPMGPDTACMARTVFLEASNQTLRGQLAVAQVIVNRMKSATYPKSACAVVGQPGQFATGEGETSADQAPSRPWETAVAIARIAQEKSVAQVVPGALFFHATYVSPGWSQTHERIAQIGDHIFYR